MRVSHLQSYSNDSVGCFTLGYILDLKNVSQRRRAQIGLFTVVVLNVGVYIWSIIMQAGFNAHDPGTIDWDDGLYARAFLPYFFVQTTGPFSQSYMYWLLSSFATDAQREIPLYDLLGCRRCRKKLTGCRECPQWSGVQVH